VHIVSDSEELDDLEIEPAIQSSLVRNPPSEHHLETGTRFRHRKTHEELIYITVAQSGKLVLMNEAKKELVWCLEAELMLDSRVNV
jgi:hypothetical protein